MRALGATLSEAGAGTPSCAGGTPQSPVPLSEAQTFTALERIAPACVAFSDTTPGEANVTEAVPSGPVAAPATLAPWTGAPVSPLVTATVAMAPVATRAGPASRSSGSDPVPKANSSS